MEQRVHEHVHINEYGFKDIAIFSHDRNYRYSLSREWKDDGSSPIIWIMLNPSIGDEKVLETTTAGCLKRSKAWGYSCMIVLNLFAYVATDPKELITSQDPVGSYNDDFIKLIDSMCDDDAKFICAWGNHGKLDNRDKYVLDLLKRRDLYALAVNKDGSPRHPLHMSHSVPPRLWRPAER